MSRILLPPWRTQPQFNARIDRGAPINRGLVFLAPLGPGNAFQDLVSGQQGTPTGLGARAFSRNGSYPLFGTSNYLDFPANPPGISGATPITIAWTQEARSTTGFSALINWKPTGATFAFVVYQSSSNASYYFTAGPRDGGTTAANFSSATGPLADNVVDSFVLLLAAGTDSGTSSNNRLFRNGVEVARGTNSAFGLNTTAAFRIGALETGGDPFEGLIGNFHIWNRVLTDNEAQTWTLNPFMTRQPQRRYWMASAAGGVTKTPGAGVLTLAGLAPSAIQTSVRSPGLGVLTLAGLAPSAIQTSVRSPGAGALVLAGLAPTITQNVIAAPGAGALTLAGLAPTVTLNAVTSPGAGALTLAGLAPTIVQNVIVAPGAGALVFNGLVPTVSSAAGVTVSPGTGALVLAGLAPTITVTANVTVSPSAGTLTLVGVAPTVVQDTIRVPAAGALTLAGLAPTVTQSVIVNPLTGALVFTGLSPTATVSDNQVVTPGAGELAFAGLVPTIPVQSPTARPAAGVLTLEGLAPTIEVTGGDTVTSAKYLGRPNVHVSGGKRKRKDEEPLPAQITNMPDAPAPRGRGLGLDALDAVPLAELPVAPAPVAPAAPAAPAPAPVKAKAEIVAPAALVAPAAPAAPAAVPAATPKPPRLVPATAADVQAQVNAAVLTLMQGMEASSEATSDRLVEVVGTLTASVDALRSEIEADRKARDLKERNLVRARQIAERLLKDIGPSA